MSRFQSMLSRLWPKCVWVLPFLVISPMAVLIPNDVFTQYPWARTYTDWLAQWIPMIDRAAHLHPHPDKFRAFFTYAWSWAPMISVLVWCVDGKRMQTELRRQFETTPVAAACWIGLLVWVAWLILYAPGDLWGSFVHVSTLIPRQDLRTFFYSSDISLFLTGAIQVFSAATLPLVWIYTLSELRARIYSIPTPDQER